jgi:hypothetical protein
MLAYVFWHRPAAGVPVEDYERAVGTFHRSLAHTPPSGLLGSASLRAEALPWLPDAAGGIAGGYEDWYVIEGWEAVGVLERAAVSRGHESAHRQAARRAAGGAGAIYRRLEGEAEPPGARLAVWISRPAGESDPMLGELLEDGVSPQQGSLWQRSLVLGPAPEFCLLTAGAIDGVTGVSPSRLPHGWEAQAQGREALGGV